MSKLIFEKFASISVFVFFALHVILVAALVHFGGSAGATFAALVFYPLILLGSVLGLAAYIRLARHPDRDNPSLLLALNVYSEAALVLLLVIVILRVSDRVLAVTLVSDTVLYGGVAGVASVFLLRGFVLLIGAYFRGDWLSQPIRLLPWRRRK